MKVFAGTPSNCIRYTRTKSQSSAAVPIAAASTGRGRKTSGAVAGRKLTVIRLVPPPVACHAPAVQEVSGPVRSGSPLPHPLDEHGDAHAVPDAEGDGPPAERAPLQSPEEGGQEHRPGGAQGVAQGDGSALHVDAVQGDAQLLADDDGDRSEGLVDLPQVD